MKHGMMTSGQMAKLMNVSKKTLRIYHEKGLLSPAMIDKSNGYRYYRPSQIQKLSEILKLRDLGFSLDMIQVIFESDDPLVPIEIMSQRLETLDKEMGRLQEARNLLKSRINNSRAFLNPPALHHCYIEYIPRRSYLGFSIEPYDASKDSGEKWMHVLNEIRGHMFQGERTREYYRNVSAILNYQALIEEGRVEYSQAVIVSEDYREDMYTRFLPQGRYACRCDIRYMSDGAAIKDSVNALMSYVDESGFEPDGLYFQEVTGEILAPGVDRHLYIVKEQVLLKSASNSLAE